MDDKYRATRTENLILRISVIGLGLSFIYYGFFIEDFLAINKVANVLFYLSLTTFTGLAVYKIIKRVIRK